MENNLLKLRFYTNRQQIGCVTTEQRTNTIPKWNDINSSVMDSVINFLESTQTGKFIKFDTSDKKYLDIILSVIDENVIQYIQKRFKFINEYSQMSICFL